MRWLLGRFFQGLLVLFLVYSGTFWLLMAVPGDPFIGERKPAPAVLEALRQRYDLDHPLRAYGGYLWRVVAHGDFGPTISYADWSVNEVLAAALPVSLSLGALALLLALWMGVAAGTLGAIFRGRWPDWGLTIFSLLGISLPSFVIGSLFLMLGVVLVPVFPSGGWGTLRQLILPALTLALPFTAYISRLTRVSVLEVLGADYIRTARAKGLGPWAIVSGHVLQNATLPVLSYLGPAAAMALTGSFVVEKLFAIPGLGTHFINACLNTDVPLVLGAVLVYTTLVIVLNTLVDLAYSLADPRIERR